MANEQQPKKPGPFDPIGDQEFDPSLRHDPNNPVRWRDPKNRKRQGWPNNETARLDPDWSPFDAG